MRLRAHLGLEWLEFESFEPLGRRITHGIFTRRGGVSRPPFASLNASPTVGDVPADRRANLARIRESLDGHPRLVTAIPAHGASSLVVTPGRLDAGDDMGDGVFLATRCDVLITRMRAVGLYWAVADCAAMLVVDPPHAVVALVHAGWRGTSLGVLPRALRRLGQYYGTRPRDLHIGIGPTIGPCCYEVGEAVTRAFRANPPAERSACFSTVMVRAESGETRPSLRLDLAESNRRQARDAGVPDDRIELSGICTGCNLDAFFSNRKEGGRTGRFACVLGLR